MSRKLSMTPKAIASRRWRAAHPDKARSRQRRYYNNVPPEVRIVRGQAKRARAIALHGREKLNAIAYRNPVRRLAAVKRYEKAHPERVRANWRRQSARNPGLKRHHSKRFTVRAKKALAIVEALATINPEIYNSIPRGRAIDRPALALRALKSMGIEIQA